MCRRSRAALRGSAGNVVNDSFTSSDDTKESFVACFPGVGGGAPG